MADNLPDVVCGPETLRSSSADSTLESLEKEAEHLKRVHFILQSLVHKRFFPGGTQIFCIYS